MGNPKDKPVSAGYQDLNQGQGQDGFSRVDCLLSPARFKKKYLFGVPMKAALTGEEIDEEDLKDFLMTAVGEFESIVRVPVSPVIITDKFDFERADDLQFSTRRLTKWPVIEVLNLSAVWPGRTEDEAIDYPTSWVSIQSDTGVMQILPNSSSLSQADAQFLHSIPYRALTLGSMKQWPNMWRVTYKAGFKEDRIPHTINHCIGIMAAIQFLSLMGPAIFPMNSVGVSIDGVSQSNGSPGPQWLAGRVQDLIAERDRIIPAIKAHYCTDLFMGVL